MTLICFVFLRLVYPMLTVSLDCPFVIAPSVFSNVYLITGCEMIKSKNLNYFSLEVKENIDKERFTVCSHKDANDLLKHVPSELNVVVYTVKSSVNSCDTEIS